MSGQALTLTGQVMFGGSRSLSPSPLLRQVVTSAVAAGCSVRVGCAIGADAQVITSCPPASLSVFAVFGPGGSGSWQGSAVSQVRAAQVRGAQVSWLAGGTPALPLRARLIQRSLATLAGCSTAVFFLAQPGPSGSLTVAAAAASRGVQVVAFSCSFSGSPAPLAGQAGSWQPAQLAGLACWAWQPAATQQSLF